MTPSFACSVLCSPFKIRSKRNFCPPNVCIFKPSSECIKAIGNQSDIVIILCICSPSLLRLHSDLADVVKDSAANPTACTPCIGISRIPFTCCGKFLHSFVAAPLKKVACYLFEVDPLHVHVRASVSSFSRCLGLRRPSALDTAPMSTFWTLTARRSRMPEGQTTNTFGLSAASTIFLVGLPHSTFRRSTFRPSITWLDPSHTSNHTSCSFPCLAVFSLHN